MRLLSNNFTLAVYYRPAFVLPSHHTNQRSKLLY